MSVIFIVTRKAIDLESHWGSNEEKPVAVFSLNEKKYESSFEELLDKYPVPDDYADMVLGREEDTPQQINLDNEIKNKKITKF